MIMWYLNYLKRSRQMMIADTPYKIELYRLLTLKSALKLEVLGMKGRGRSAYSIIKEELGIKGNKQKVLDQVNQMLDSIKQRKGIA